MEISRIKTVLARIAGAVVLILAGLYVVQTLRGPHGVPEVVDKRRQIQQLREQNANLARENEQKRQRIIKLREDRSEQELEIRRRLKLLKQKETTFIIQDSEK